ncbi:MAG: HEAT repeat domain-containing protein [Pirellulaceae bacterium]
MRLNGKTIRPRGLSALGLALAVGCSGSTPTKTVETPNVPNTLPDTQYIAVPGATSRPVAAAARPIYDYNIAPAEYNVRPLAQWTEQEAAADALGRIGPPAVPQLIEALGSPQADSRLQAIQVLARMGSDAKQAVPDLIRLLDDPDERIRKAATRTLGRIGPDAAPAVPALMRTLLEPPPPTPPR